MATLSITLGFAAQGGCVACLRLLLRAGADACAEDRETSTTPLHVAAASRQPLAVQLLLDQGASVEAVDRWGRTPLVYATQAAAAGDAAALAVMQTLLRHAAPTTAADDEGRLPLHYAEHVSACRLLLQHCGTSDAVDRSDRQGRTPLARAVRLQPRSRRSAVALALIAAGARAEGLRPRDRRRLGRCVKNRAKTASGAARPAVKCVMLV